MLPKVARGRGGGVALCTLILLIGGVGMSLLVGSLSPLLVRTSRMGSGLTGVSVVGVPAKFMMMPKMRGYKLQIKDGWHIKEIE